jgi:hypothetical protein
MIPEFANDERNPSHSLTNVTQSLSPFQRWKGQ